MTTFANRMDGLSGSAIRQILGLCSRPGMISLAGGNPSPETFPAQDVAEITAKLMAEQGGAVLQYGMTAGWVPLQESIVEIVAKKGIKTDPSHIIILTGSTQGIELAAKVLLNAGDVILVEDPTFLGALQTFRTYQAVPVGVGMDEDGIDLADLEEKMIRHKAKVLYTIPTFQNPTGRTMCLEKRKRVLELAKKHDVIILEDDPYGDLRYEGEFVPQIKSMDDEGRVILLGTFSKIVSPGLRVGYAVADAEILQKMNIGKQGMDVHTSNLSQAIVDAYWRSGKLPGHIQDCCDLYRVRRDAMMDALAKYFPKGVRWTHPQGGLFLWVTLPEGVDAMKAFNAAVEQSVAFVPGEHFYPDLSGKNTMRLNFSMPSPEMIGTAIERLGAIIAEQLG